MKQSQTIKKACQVLRSKVLFERAGFVLPGGNLNTIDNDTAAIRQATRLYIDTWVLPILELIESGDMGALKRLMEYEHSPMTNEESLNYKPQKAENLHAAHDETIVHLRKQLEESEKNVSELRAKVDELKKESTALPHIPSIPQPSMVEWQGYTIKQHPEHPEGFIVLDTQGSNCMPGATWFKTLKDAKKGIAAHKLSQATGGDFWDFIELTR
jgi:hypothetical protein